MGRMAIKSVGDSIIAAELIRDGVGVPQQLGEVNCCSGGLDGLAKEVSKALLVCANREMVAKEVVAPFLNSFSNGIELLNIYQRRLHSWVKFLVEKCKWVIALKKYGTNGDGGSIGFDDKR